MRRKGCVESKGESVIAEQRTRKRIQYAYGTIIHHPAPAVLRSFVYKDLQNNTPMIGQINNTELDTIGGKSRIDAEMYTLSHTWDTSKLRLMQHGESRGVGLGNTFVGTATAAVTCVMLKRCNLERTQMIDAAYAQRKRHAMHA